VELAAFGKGGRALRPMASFGQRNMERAGSIGHMDGRYIAEYINARTADTAGRSLARIEASRRDIAATRKRRWHTVRGGSTSDRQLGHLRERILRFVNRHELPRVKAGYNTRPKLCDCCGRSIARGSPEYDIAFAALTFVLDAECFGVWQEEMGPPKEQGK
jgi:hypothetical protein